MSSPYLIAFVVFLAGCFGVQTLALDASGGKTTKSESNYFSSIARLQTESQSKPKAMLLGSSMTGRMADRAAAIPGIANLGCDGGSAVVTLRAMDKGLLPTAPLLIVEANSLAYELEGRGKEIAGAIASEWFDLGSRYPNLGSTSRPTAFAYSWLMARKEGPPTSDPDGLPISSKPAILDPKSAPDLDGKAAALVDELVGIIERLETKGNRVILVMIPPGASDADSVQAKLPRALACKAGVPWWDLNEGLPSGTVAFTDGLHLDSAGAAKVLATLARAVDSD